MDANPPNINPSVATELLLPSKMGRNTLVRILDEVYRLNADQYEVYEERGILGAKILLNGSDNSGATLKRNASLQVHIASDKSCASVSIYPRIGSGTSITPQVAENHLTAAHNLHPQRIDFTTLNTCLQYASQGYIILKAPVACQSDPQDGTNTIITPVEPTLSYASRSISTPSHNPYDPCGTAANPDPSSEETPKERLAPLLSKRLTSILRRRKNRKQPVDTALAAKLAADLDAKRNRIAKHAQQLLWHTTAPIIVSRGDHIARITPATDPRDGMLVTGEAISAKKPTMHNVIKTGKGVEMLGDIISATTHGLVVFADNTFEVIPYDVHRETSQGESGKNSDMHLKSDGGIILYCDVEKGSTIEGAAIYAMGSVQSSTLIAKSSVYIAHGVAGNGSVIRGTTVHCSYCSQASIYAHIIMVDSYIFNSKIWATKSILTNDDTVVSGGVMTFYHNAYLGVVGTHGSSAATIYMGLNYQAANKIHQLKSQSLTIQGEIMGLQKGLKNDDNKNTKDHPQHTLDHISSLESKIESIQTNIDYLSKILYNSTFYLDAASLQEGSKLHSPSRLIVVQGDLSPATFSANS